VKYLVLLPIYIVVLIISSSFPIGPVPTTAPVFAQNQTKQHLPDSLQKYFDEKLGMGADFTHYVKVYYQSNQTIVLEGYALEPPVYSTANGVLESCRHLKD
jgi:hypothetical protein